MGKGWRTDRQRRADRAWEAGRGRTGFILSRNAFQCVCGELELPCCTPARWIDSRRIAGEWANYVTARLNDTNTSAGRAAMYCCTYHIISITLYSFCHMVSENNVWGQLLPLDNKHLFFFFLRAHWMFCFKNLYIVRFPDFLSSIWTRSHSSLVTDCGPKHWPLAWSNKGIEHIVQCRQWGLFNLNKRLLDMR